MKKHVSLPTLLKRRREWKRKRRTVVFTNGCFDILHPGHVRLLSKARACGDALIVGLNSDASVRRLKGRGRPIQDAAARAEILSALEAVDAVVLFGEETPAELLSNLRTRAAKQISLTGESEQRPWDRRLPWLAALWVGGVSAFLAWFVFDGLPHIDDSVAYLFQAKYFSYLFRYRLDLKFLGTLPLGKPTDLFPVIRCCLHVEW